MLCSRMKYFPFSPQNFKLFFHPQRHPFLALFDGPDTNNSSEARRNSIVPQQALFALNNGFVDEQAKLFARRLLAARSDDDARLRYAQELAWSRSPTRVELAKYECWLQRARQLLACSSRREEAHSDSAKELEPPHVGCYDVKSEEEAWTSLARVLLTANEFFYVD